MVDLNDKITNVLGKIARFAGLESVAGFFGVGPEVTPGTAPASNTQSSQININAPVTVEAQPGLTAEEAAIAVETGMQTTFSDILRQTSRATEPATDF